MRGSDVVEKKRNRKITIGDKTYDSRNSGTYIPSTPKHGGRTDEKKKSVARSPRTQARKKSMSIASKRRDSSTPGSIIGGIKGSNIRAKNHVTSTPVERELTKEERRQIWQPPSTRYVVPSSRVSSSTDSTTTREATRTHTSKKLKVKGAVFRKRSSSKTNKKGPLSSKEEVRLDQGYRMWGGNPGWEGWSRESVPGRTKDFLQDEARRLELDLPDDSVWTIYEARTLALNREAVPASSASWKRLLPRKSSVAISFACEFTPPDTRGLSKGQKRRSYECFGIQLGMTIKKLMRSDEETFAGIVEASSSPCGASLKHRRLEWEYEAFSFFYELYGSLWFGWKRLLPWLNASSIATDAAKMGFGERWSDEEKASFISNEGIGWSLEELNELIREYPLKSNASLDLRTELSRHGQEEQREIAKLLGIPSKALMDELSEKAKSLR